MSTIGAWFKRRGARSNGTSRRSGPTGYGGFLSHLRATFSAPEPESEALKQLVVNLSSMTSQHLPRSKRKWLQLLVESPYLDGPLGVYADAFAEIAFEVYEPRNKGPHPRCLSRCRSPNPTTIGPWGGSPRCRPESGTPDVRRRTRSRVPPCPREGRGTRVRRTMRSGSRER